MGRVNQSTVNQILSAYLSGTASESEKKIIEEHYEAYQKNGQAWDSQLMGDKEVVGQSIYFKIQQNISTSKKPQFYKSRIVRYAAVFLLIINTSIAIYYFRKAKPAFYNEINISTAIGEVKKISLSDGSIIWLNAGSQLSYPKTFDENRREVTLTGEAYFQIAHYATKPFIVHTGKLITQVLGTSFNIKAYTDDKDFKISVLTGKVGVFESKKDSKLPAQFLVANESLVYDKHHEKFKPLKHTDSKVETVWIEKKLVFQNTTLEEVVNVLERHFNVSIHLTDPSLSEYKLYADFNEPDIDKIINKIALSLDLKVTEEGRNYKISPQTVLRSN